MTLLDSIRVCVEDIGFDFIDNPFIKHDYKNPYWIKEVGYSFIIIMLGDISNDVFTRNSLMWLTDCFDADNDDVRQFKEEYEQQLYKNINTWIYIQKKRGLPGGGELEVYKWDRILPGCCLYCQSGHDGCWCNECTCKNCDAYKKCKCGNNKGYCDLINYECSDCRKDKTHW